MKKKVICQSCKKGHAIIGNYATSCSHCGASINPDTGTPYMVDGKPVYTAQLNGKD